MQDVHNCDNCSGGCTSKRSEDQNYEEASAAPYLLFAAIAIVLMSLIVRWLFF